MKNPLVCQGCGKTLKADGLQPLSVHACPNCGNSITVPFAGMGSGKFTGLYFGSWFAISILSLILCPGGLLLVPFWFGFKLWIGYQRAANIGWNGYAAAWVLLPFLGAIVLACHKTGEGMKRVKA